MSRAAGPPVCARARQQLGELVDEVFVRVSRAGRGGEVDWGEAIAVIAGAAIKVHLFLMRASLSGACFVRAHVRETQQAFLEGHVAAFEFFGGVFGVVRTEYVPRHIFGLLCPTRLCACG